ncbi:MAG TPA: glycosyltransferase family 2 protein [Vicinamibacterales bacterium]|nr:glycosyltransferase family 2 protein [Vicinamibacterales bacterium]
MTAPLDLSIVIVSFNACVDLDRCLQSLHDAPPSRSHEILVVDNASSDGSADAARHWSDVQVIETGANLGFSAGNNVGIRASHGTNVLLLNSDTIVPAGAVDALLTALERHTDVAVVGPRLVDAAGRAELSFGPMVGPFAELRQKWIAKGDVDRLTRREQFPDWVSGACLLVRRSDAEAVGLLDERYTMYLEDVDFCAAIRARGRRILFAPDVQFTHLRGRSRLAAPASTDRAYRRSHIAFYVKHHPRWAPLLKLYLKIRGADS